MDKESKTKKIVKDYYAKAATTGGVCGGGCCQKRALNSEIAKSIGYSEQEIEIAGGANLGLGCGNPTAMAKINEGEVVVDLGSGAGLDCFLAARRVGDAGQVIGIDMTEEMVRAATAGAEARGCKNVEFKLGDIENIPLADSSADVIISNCVINLAPDKSRVFNEAFRILRKGGRMYVSDIVLLEELPEVQRQDDELIAGCVGGALLRDEYIELIKNAGFQVKILSEDRDISKRQYQGIPLESLKVEAKK